MIVNFYFDFMSPYAYLACTQIERLSQKYAARATFKCHAFDMWAARLAAGNNGPSNREQPAKSAVMMADVGRWAKRYGIPVKPPGGFDSNLLNRSFWVAEELESGIPFMTVAARKVWGEGGDPSDPELIKSAAAEVALDGEAVFQEAETARIIEVYAKVNQDAQARGIFGAPMFAVDDQVYWGNDRIEFVEEYIQEHSGGH